MSRRARTDAEPDLQEWTLNPALGGEGAGGVRIYSGAS